MSCEQSQFARCSLLAAHSFCSGIILANRTLRARIRVRWEEHSTGENATSRVAIVTLVTLNLVSSRTCAPQEGRRGTERRFELTMQCGRAGRDACSEVVLTTPVVAHRPRKVPLSSASGRVRDDIFSGVGATAKGVACAGQPERRRAELPMTALDPKRPQHFDILRVHRLGYI